MKRYRVLIVDDEAPARRKLARQLSRFDGVELVGEAEDGIRALQLIEEKKPELVMLDIQMPGMTGFDVVRLMQAPRPKVIFVTAYDEYAVRAFEVAAMDYLLKPVSDDRLKEAFTRVQQIPADPTAILDVLEQPTYTKRLAVRHLKRVKLINVEDIGYITSELRVVYIYDQTGSKHWTHETLDQLQKRLDPEHFFRIHRSSIINLSATFEIEPWEDGRLKIHFPDETVLTAARTPAGLLRKILNF